MNFLPGVLLYLNFSSSDALYITNHFYRKEELTNVYENQFSLCMELIQKTKDLIKALDLNIYLERIEFLDALLIRWFTSFFCTVLNASEVKNTQSHSTGSNFCLGDQLHAPGNEIRHQYIPISSSADSRAPQEFNPCELV
jgi:hypothetical protein